MDMASLSVLLLQSKHQHVFNGISKSSHFQFYLDKRSTFYMVKFTVMLITFSIVYFHVFRILHLSRSLMYTNKLNIVENFSVFIVLKCTCIMVVISIRYYSLKYD